MWLSLVEWVTPCTLSNQNCLVVFDFISTYLDLVLVKDSSQQSLNTMSDDWWMDMLPRIQQKDLWFGRIFCERYGSCWMLWNKNESKNTCMGIIKKLYMNTSSGGKFFTQVLKYSVEALFHVMLLYAATPLFEISYFLFPIHLSCSRYLTLLGINNLHEKHLISS